MIQLSWQPNVARIVIRIYSVILIKMYVITTLCSYFLYLYILGLLTIAHSLDHEHQPEYILNITASDHGIPQQVAYQILYISVEDVNDLPPEFNPAVYEMNVTENLAADTFVGQVTATDGDTGKV